MKSISTGFQRQAGAQAHRDDRKDDEPLSLGRSQYERIRIPGERGAEIRFVCLGMTEGFVLGRVFPAPQLRLWVRASRSGRTGRL